MKHSTAPTLHLCSVCGLVADVAGGIDENGHARWLCDEHLHAELVEHCKRRRPSSGRGA